MLKINHPTKHFCILVQAPFGTLFPFRLCTFFDYLRQICIKFVAELASKFKNLMKKQQPSKKNLVSNNSTKA